MRRAELSLAGLSVGDAFGEGFFGFGANVEFAIPQRWLAPMPWPYTDDTVMAISIVEVLSRFGRIDQDELAGAFARRFEAEPNRGYGPTAARILGQILRGADWREASSGVFGGTGSMGNGSAMRVGPVGAYFADDLAETARQAVASAQVTHHHPEAVAGAIATAVAAAAAWQAGRAAECPDPGWLLETAIEHTPPGLVRDGLRVAARLPADMDPVAAAAILGNGSQVTCSDTVPFCIWCSGKHLHDYEEALWAVVSALGDADTNCAIVGSIVALPAGAESIPSAWLAAREPLPEASR